jgi:hypothetical protein
MGSMIRGASFIASLGLVAACLPRQQLLPALGLPVPAQREFPADFQLPRSSETQEPITGFGGGGGGVHRTPIILIHGNTEAPRFWNEARDWLLAHGYTRDEVWALGYGYDCTCHFDSNDGAVPTVEAFVTAVQDYLRRRSGLPVAQVNIVAHSLGVTLVRQWMKQDNAWHRVRNFIAVAGANHGTWISPPDAHGISRAGPLELYPGSPWLAQLNRGGETPGATRYLALYDGSGWYDVFYAPWQKDSPALAGAQNLAWNREHPGAGLGHLDLPREPQTLAAMADFIAEGGEPLPNVPAPEILRQGEILRPDQEGARLRCATGGDYPGAATPPTHRLALEPGVLYTCYAEHPGSGLSSPMARFKRALAPARRAAPTLRADPPAGAYRDPLRIRLHSDDPEAYIVYTTSGALPDTGSPLYVAPIVANTSIVLQAQAIAPDGRRSPRLRLDYRIEAGQGQPAPAGFEVRP